MGVHNPNSRGHTTLWIHEPLSPTQRAPKKLWVSTLWPKSGVRNSFTKKFQHVTKKPPNSYQKKPSSYQNSPHILPKKTEILAKNPKAPAPSSYQKNRNLTGGFFGLKKDGCGVFFLCNWQEVGGVKKGGLFGMHQPVQVYPRGGGGGLKDQSIMFKMKTALPHI